MKPPYTTWEYTNTHENIETFFYVHEPTIWGLRKKYKQDTDLNVYVHIQYDTYSNVSS